MGRPKTKKRPAKKSKRKFLLIPYPLFVFFLICVGVYLVAWTVKAHADQTIKAVIHAQPVSQPADIDPSLTEGTHYTNIPIEISGSCPVNAAYVEIFRNGVMSGSAICYNGRFDTLVDLFPGKNIIVAHVFNETDDEGPVSSSLDLYYDPPQSSQIDLETAQSSPDQNKTLPLLLRTAFVYKGYYVGQEVEWPIEISGGTPPYALNVDWGDGVNDLISRVQDGELKLTHTYSKPGGYKGSYSVKVKASDSADQQAYLQYFLIVNPAGIISGINNKPAPLCVGYSGHFYAADLSCSVQRILHKTSWLWVAWPFYIILVLMTMSFWLGEREEFLSLGRRHLLR